MKTEPRKAVPLLLVLTLGLSACGGSGGSTPGGNGTTGGALTTGGGATVSTTPVSSTPLDKSSLTTFSQTNQSQVESSIVQFATGTGFALGGISPLSLDQGRLGAQALSRQGLNALNVHPASLKAEATDPCTRTTGNTTDADKDGIYADYKATFNCSETSSGLSSNYKGTGYLHDKNDNDPKSGFHFDIDSAGTTSGVSSGTTINIALDLKLYLDVDPNASGGYKARYVYNYNLSGNGSNSGRTATVDAHVLLDQTLESTPDSDRKGTTVTLSGSASTSGSTSASGSSSSSLNGALTYSGKLHYSVACGGIDSGSLTYSSGSNTVTYTYSGCKVYSAK